MKQTLGKARGVGLCVLALASALLAGCTSGGPSTGNTKPLNQLSWCDQKYISFRDDTAQDSTAITDWSKVKPQLGFTVYLPPTLPNGACLVLAGGAIHDQVLGGQMNISWVLSSSQGPIAFSETPKHAGASSTVQCVQSEQDAKTNICFGAVQNTNISIAGRLSNSDLTAYFSNLAADVDWVPSA